MAISNLAPIEDAIIDPDSAVTFDIDDSYTYLRIEVDTADGVVYAYDSTLGGAQLGYEVSIETVGSVESFTITADSGWDKTPQVLYVTEDETGTEAITTITWNLSGTLSYPKDSDPYYGQFTSSFKVTEDNAGGAANVGWIDVVGPVGGEDGISIVNLGDGKLRLTANATTNDPNAIHDNVANEISAITEKTSVHDDDIIFIEDSEASYVKKFVKKKNMGGARNPAKLTTDYSASLLYTFDGDRTNSATAGTPADYDLGTAQGTELYTVGVTDAQKAMRIQKTIGCSSTAGTPVAAVAAVGEVTVQVVLMTGDPAPQSGTTEANIFGCASDGVNGEATWSIRGANNGTDYWQPAFEYVDTGAGAVSVTDSTFVAPWGTLMHIVGRRVDDGAGTYTASLWVNGVKIAENLTELAANAATASHKILVAKTGTANTGLCEGLIESLKVSNVALTDAEIRIEYLSVIGAPAE